MTINIAFALQICATRYYGVLTGNLPTIPLKKMFLTELSTVPFFLLVTPNMSATPPTQPSPTLAPDSACPTPLSAARVGPRVQPLGGSATGGAWLGAGAASSPPAPGPPSEKILDQLVHNWQWRLRKKDVKNNV